MEPVSRPVDRIVSPEAVIEGQAPKASGYELAGPTLFVGMGRRVGLGGRFFLSGEAALSFLGLGVQPPTPSWGTMLNGGRAHLLDAPHLTVFPGLAIALLVLGFNFLGDGLRDLTDPKLKR